MTEAASPVPPAEPSERESEARAALIAASPPTTEGKADTPQATAPTAPTATEAADDLGWLVTGCLVLIVWIFSKRGAEALARLDRVRAFGKRAGARLGPRAARWLGAGYLVALSVVGEGVDMLASEALRADKAPDAPKP